MEPTLNTNPEFEPIDATETVEEIEFDTNETIEAPGASEEPEASEASEDERGTDDRRHGRGRGRRGPFGGRPFGPNRPYRFALFVEEDGSYVLRSPDLADRTTQVGSLDDVGAAMQAAIEQRAAEDAKAAEDAAKDAEYSGKFVLRLPRSMHRQLAELAEAEGVSLNQLALAFLAQGMGRVDSEEESGGRRGPRGDHRGHGPRGGRGRHDGRGPEGRGPDGRDFERRGPRGPRMEGRGPEHRFGGRGPEFGRGDGPGFDREMGRNRRRAEMFGFDGGMPDGPRTV